MKGIARCMQPQMPCHHVSSGGFNPFPWCLPSQLECAAFFMQRFATKQSYRYYKMLTIHNCCIMTADAKAANTAAAEGSPAEGRSLGSGAAQVPVPRMVFSREELEAHALEVVKYQELLDSWDGVHLVPRLDEICREEAARLQQDSGNAAAAVHDSSSTNICLSEADGADPTIAEEHGAAVTIQRKNERPCKRKRLSEEHSHALHHRLTLPDGDVWPCESPKALSNSA